MLGIGLMVLAGRRIQDLYLASPAFLKKKGLFLNVGGMGVAFIWREFLGFFVMIANSFIYPSFLPHGVPRKYAFFSGSANQESLKEVVKLVEDSKLTVPIDSVWEMEDAREAYKVIDSKRARGKVIVKVQEV